MIDAKKIQEISIQILRTHSGSGESRRATHHALGSQISANLLYIERSGTSFLLAFWLQTLWQRQTLALVWSLAKASFQTEPNYFDSKFPAKAAPVPPVAKVFAQWLLPFVPWPSTWREALSSKKSEMVSHLQRESKASAASPCLIRWWGSCRSCAGQSTSLPHKEKNIFDRARSSLGACASEFLNPHCANQRSSTGV